MGAVSSRSEDAPALYLRDSATIALKSITVSKGDAPRETMFTITPNVESTFVSARSHGDALIEFVQDPDTAFQTQLAPLLLKVPYDDDLRLTFNFVLRRPLGKERDTCVEGLTFMNAPHRQELESLLTKEFVMDSNLQKHPNARLVAQSLSTDGMEEKEIQWSWDWNPPGEEDERHRGWRNTCCFVEYDKTADTFAIIASFAFWVSNTSPVLTTFMPPLHFPIPLLPNSNDPMSVPSSPVMGKQHVPPRLHIQTTSFTSEGSETKVGSDSPEMRTPVAEREMTVFGSPPTSTQMNMPSLSTVPTNTTAIANSNTEPEDGPLFRATISSMEKQTVELKQKIKKVMKRAQEAVDAHRVATKADERFVEALQVAATSSTSLKPLLDVYMEPAYRELRYFAENNAYQLQHRIIEPLRRQYDADIKTMETKKRDFEDESKEYYGFLSRYLSQKSDAKEKKQMQSDTKYQKKRKDFELHRFDYYSYMQDIHGGRKEAEIVENVTEYAWNQFEHVQQTARTIGELRGALEMCRSAVQQSKKDFRVLRTEREERRRQLETGEVPAEKSEKEAAYDTYSVVGSVAGSTAPLLGQHGQYSSSESEGVPIPTVTNTTAAMLSPSPPSMSKPQFKSLPETEFNAIDAARRKEGLLWALSRPAGHTDPKVVPKMNWHKYWVVLAGGQLCEYSNWKQQPELHNAINLRMATVREARSADRRFCFEVITPQFKRVYQATSQEDMQSWISVISNAIGSVLEGSSSIRHFEKTKFRGSIDTGLGVNVGEVLRSSSKKSPMPPQIRPSSSNRPPPQQTGYFDDPALKHAAEEAEALNLLKKVREADPTNTSCADCGSQNKAEWVAINFGAVVCIECSGVHRSLGTHISKMRSLTLDTKAMTPDLVDLLVALGNRKHNTIWEATLAEMPGPIAAPKPSPSSAREVKVKFVQAKYVHRAYVRTTDTASANALLLEAIQRRDVFVAMSALAAGAEPNVKKPGTEMSAVLIAILAAVPETALAEDKLATSAEAHEDYHGTYPIAELLLQNGAEVPTLTHELVKKLPLSAKIYLAQKASRSGAPQTQSTPTRQPSVRQQPPVGLGLMQGGGSTSSLANGLAAMNINNTNGVKGVNPALQRIPTGSGKMPRLASP
ncbi:ArfGap-domain-containing protein [Saitoella complicata NRRL Y-17804]|uniref:ADP-ribosylation factor GTPase-activating protein n=1 Tax=Saitoella complicata (strain BCRC 22490 / CBS 7301 / JCM 7358 / NBRC 10748 / NRRL Y-17804) TaxID=698492 RepID=A0A0E9NBE0_SAICN|nr:ArfGap-domain-containing protein [Saitoella complicata NRRL Y-17804]ODQ55289.1 ArfGap-domain-containing protein [Saitoella complicata NRRL Y-17804]GAO47123.1 hypothetical protein G7K_1334-t1 [Saitoella complicata NRRL Y-17804]